MYNINELTHTYKPMSHCQVIGPSHGSEYLMEEAHLKNKIKIYYLFP